MTDPDPQARISTIPPPADERTCSGCLFWRTPPKPVGALRLCFALPVYTLELAREDVASPNWDAKALVVVTGAGDAAVMTAPDHWCGLWAKGTP